MPKKTVLKSVRKSAVDHIVGHISLLFELVYKESYRQAKEQGYVYKLLDFKSDVPEVNAEFGDMRLPEAESLIPQALIPG